MRRLDFIRNRSKILQHMISILLFSILGGFSFLLLINHTELAERAPDSINSFRAAVTTIVVFNIFGFCIQRINEHLSKNSPLFYSKQSRLIWHYLFITIVLLLLNYAIFVSVKWLAGTEHFFIMRQGGIRLILIIWLIELIIVGLICVNHSMSHTLRLYQEKKQLQEEAARAQYHALQNQLNPHFLFNSLNTLLAEIEYNPQNAALFTQKLSDVYRYILQWEDQQLVSLAQELEFLDDYVFLHRVRLGECLSVDNRLPEEVMSAKIPPLALQLLAENVIKHNYINEKHPIAICLSTNEAGDTLSVSNELHPKQNPLQSGKGLRNLSERYRLFCNKSISVNSTDQSFSVLVPLLYE